MLQVAAFTGGWAVPSARFRIRQYIPHLVPYQIELNEFVSRFGAYPPVQRPYRLLWAVSTLADRSWVILKARRFNLTILQREMLSTFFTLEPLTKRPRILDVDDAIWLRRGGRFAKRLAEICQGVICGNAFLADVFGAWNRNVVILPTAVDTARFFPKRVHKETLNGEVICWSGVSSGFMYLSQVERPLSIVLSRRPGRRLRIISDREPGFRILHPDLVEYIPWSLQTEVNAIQTAAVGIMPLDDSLLSRGKCAYKLLTYLACGLPVVASPVGMNKEILQQGEVGFGARTKDEWVDSLEFILAHPNKAIEMGSVGRHLIERKYSLSALSPVFAQTLRQYA
jgi:glycosyltransferase involved in cell wall biosynthesis